MKKAKISKVERFYKGLPVRDARANILVQPSLQDIDHSIKGDPENCAYACCLKRTLNTTTVFIYKSIAYVQTLDEEGNPILERYSINKKARTFIDNFDRGKTVPPSGFVFQAPAKTDQLNYRQEWMQKARELDPQKHKNYNKNHQRNLLLGTVKSRRPVQTLKGSFRDGVGQVKFIGQGRKLRKHNQSVQAV